MTEIIDSLADVAGRYDALFCDVWGVYHNGVAPLPGAVAALKAFRARGGCVVLLTNAPRPESEVRKQLSRMNAPDDSFDAVASSGGAAQAAVARGDWGTKVHHIGAEKDLPFFDGAGVELVSLAEADSIVCTGLAHDHRETPEDYDDRLTEGALRKLPFLCANPDIVVDVGDERRWCAGALAELYRAKGGAVTEYGKPHPQIYDYARRVLTETTGRVIDDDRILCVGDGIRTDVAGAMGEGLDCLFVTGGLAAKEVNRPDGAPDPARLTPWLSEHGFSPRYAIGTLR